MLAVMVIATGIIAGCSSLPERYNMTGTWKYTFEETGKSVVQDGSMTLAQESYKLKGKCSDAFGEFDLTGTITEQSTKFMIDGRRNDGKRNFHLTATMSSAAWDSRYRRRKPSSRCACPRNCSEPAKQATFSPRFISIRVFILKSSFPRV